MEIKKYKVNDTEFEFVCESWSNSRAWGHKVTLLRNGLDYGERKVRYYNRTWEMFQYQTCMLGVLREEMENTVRQTYEKYKEENCLSRLSESKKAEIVEDLKANNEYYKEFAKVYDSIYNGNRQGGEI